MTALLRRGLGRCLLGDVFRRVLCEAHLGPVLPSRLLSDSVQACQQRGDGPGLTPALQRLPAKQRGAEREWTVYLRELNSSAADLTPRSISHLLYLCKVHGHPHPSAVSLLVSAAEGRLAEGKSFDAAETAAVVHSLGRLVRSQQQSPFPPPLHGRASDLALALTEKLLVQTHRADVTDLVLAKIMYGLGTLFGGEGDVCEQHPRLKGCIEALSAEICQNNHLVSFAQSGLANVLCAYGCLRYRSGGREIASMIMALHRLEYRNEELLLTLAVEVTSGQHLPHLKEQDLCNVLYGLQSLATPSAQGKLRPVMARLFFEAARPDRIKKYNSQDLSTLLQSLAAYVCPSRSRSPFTDRLIQELLNRYGILLEQQPKLQKDINAALSACIKMGVRDDVFLQKVDRCIVETGHSLESVWTLTLLLWSLANLKTLTPEAFLTLSNRLCDLRENGHQMLDPNWVQLTQAIQYMERLRSQIELEPRVQDLLEEAVNVSKTTKLGFTLPS